MKSSQDLRVVYFLALENKPAVYIHIYKSAVFHKSFHLSTLISVITNGVNQIY